MVIIDGSFLFGVAAVLTSIATLWRAVMRTETRSEIESNLIDERSLRRQPNREVS